ncbi:hypothetical protein EMIHUDRAFT_364358, partial [Emiliania huxleyi CCMP1516]|uniref:Uncharacterized protein n=2 Tax=Emiliania huxleyi TaxID=2903 RepID=A0A0D3KA24_EMIH1
VLGLGMLNEKLRRGKRFRARALSFDNHHIYLRFRDREEEAAAARAPKPPTWRRSNTMSELPADRRTARQAAERHYPTRRSPLSRLSPLGRRSPDKRRTDDTASLI